MDFSRFFSIAQVDRFAGQFLRFLWGTALTPLFIVGVAGSAAAQATIFVNSQTSNSGGCSLQEAIYAANFDANVALDVASNAYASGCVAGSGSDTIVLEAGQTYTFDTVVNDFNNYMGPTATPIIFTDITIQANGATLQRAMSAPNMRLFSVGTATVTVTPPGGSPLTVTGTGNLTIQDAYIKGFQVRGGDGANGGGGGMGAGGAIYVAGGTLTVIACTFSNNAALGGSGSVNSAGVGGGGGGGISGNGGAGGDSGGGGGGGARGMGGFGRNLAGGGGGGGTVTDGGNAPQDARTGGLAGIACGGRGGDSGSDGSNAPCPGGGGGGGGTEDESANLGFGAGPGRGGDGNYGGGGGGGGRQGPATLVSDGDGAIGGFGGGGGSGNRGGAGGYGGAGGESTGFTVITAQPLSGGAAGRFGGRGGHPGGGGGAGLGGAIFSHNGNVTIQNSTFSNNSVIRGSAAAIPPTDPCNFGCIAADNGQDEGGAIFAVDGRLTVQNATIVDNTSTGEGAGIVFDMTHSPAFFTLENTIISNPSARECFYTAGVDASGAGNLIVNNFGCKGMVASASPLLDPLTLNRPGSVPTMALLLGSPAISAADAATSLATDERGVTRKAAPDIGAYESIPEADLRLTKAVSSSTARAGDLVTYTLTLTNLGPDTANSVTVTDNFPSELTYGSCTATSGGSCSAQGASYSSLAANSQQTITISGILHSGLTRGTLVTNTASVQASSPKDSDNNNNSGTASFTVLVPDFSISAGTPVTIAVGGSGTSSVTVGSIDTFSSGVSLSATIPPSFQKSFSANPVTPPSNGSTASNLKLSLGPSVTAGSYTVSATGTSGALTHSATINVIVKTTIAGVANVINADVGIGAIDNAGIGTALTSKLAVAQNAMAAGQTQVEINTLQATLSQINAQGGKHIKTSWVDGSGQSFNPDAVLVSDVTDLLVNAGANLKANPILGNVVNANGAGLSGLAVSILNSKNAIVATATTDVTGFYYFPATTGLASGSTYTIKVMVPKGYKGSTPASQNFTWKSVGIALANFIVN